MTRPLSGLLLLLATGCAPIYVPGSVHVPMQHRSGDFHASLHGGTQGGQVDAAFAVTDSVAVRATAQAFAGTRQNPDGHGTYVSGGGGFSLFHGGGQTTGAGFASGLRASVNLELHGGRSDGQGALTISNPPSDVVYSGPWVRPAFQADVGYEWEYFALGAAARFTVFQFWHDRNSELAGQSASLFAAEPFAFARFGTGALKFQLQTGLSLPFAGQGNMGIPFPLHVSGGVVLDL